MEFNWTDIPTYQDETTTTIMATNDGRQGVGSGHGGAGLEVDYNHDNVTLACVVLILVCFVMVLILVCTVRGDRREERGTTRERRQWESDMKEF